MKTDELIIKIANKVGKIHFMKVIFRNIYDWFLERKLKKSISNFQKNGLEALEVFNQVFTENGYKYSLAFGTLLGSIREKDFIPHDDDLDLAMWINDYSPEIIDKLEEKGVKLVCSFTVNGDQIGKEQTFCYKGVLIDIFYFYRDNDGIVYCCDFVNQPNCSDRYESIKKHGGLLPRKIMLPLGEELITIDFKGLKVSIPKNYSEILSFRYGVDFMTPKPGWKPQTNYIKPMYEFLGIYKEY